MPPLLDAGGDVVALVKPQFEAGRAEVGKGGIVRDDACSSVSSTTWPQSAVALGLERVGTVESPIAGHGRQPRDS